MSPLFLGQPPPLTPKCRIESTEPQDGGGQRITLVYDDEWKRERAAFPRADTTVPGLLFMFAQHAEFSAELTPTGASSLAVTATTEVDVTYKGETKTYRGSNPEPIIVDNAKTTNMYSGAQPRATVVGPDESASWTVRAGNRERSPQPGSSRPLSPITTVVRLPTKKGETPSGKNSWNTTMVSPSRFATDLRWEPVTVNEDKSSPTTVQYSLTPAFTDNPADYTWLSWDQVKSQTHALTAVRFESQPVQRDDKRWFTGFEAEFSARGTGVIAQGDRLVLWPGRLSSNRDDRTALPRGSAIEYALGTIEGTVFWDHNRSGFQEAGEPPLAGATIAITGTDARTPGKSIVTTDKHGHYSFHNVSSPGTYTVTLERTPGSADSPGPQTSFVSYYDATTPVTPMRAHFTHGEGIQATTTVPAAVHDRVNHVDFGLVADDARIVVDETVQDSTCDESLCTVSWDINVTNAGNTSIAPGATIYDRLPADIKDIQVTSFTHGGAQTTGGLASMGYAIGGEQGRPATRSAQPTEGLIPITATVTAVSGHRDTMAALDSQGKIWTWGANNSGQLGRGDTNTTDPVRLGTVPGDRRYIDVSAGRRHMAAIDDQGILYTWGNNSTRSLGGAIQAAGAEPEPLRAFSSTRFVKVSAGDDFNLALTSEGYVYGWGSNEYGKARYVSDAQTPSPVQLDGLPRFVDVVAGLDSAAGLTTDGTIKVWGRQHRPFTDDHDSGSSSDYGTIVGDRPFTKIALASTLLALDADGRLWQRHPGGKLTRLTEQTFQDITIAQGLAGALDTQGRLWHWRIDDGKNTPTQCRNYPTTPTLWSKDRYFSSIHAAGCSFFAHGSVSEPLSASSPREITPVASETKDGWTTRTFKTAEAIRPGATLTTRVTTKVPRTTTDQYIPNQAWFTSPTTPWEKLRAHSAAKPKAPGYPNMKTFQAYHRTFRDIPHCRVEGDFPEGKGEHDFEARAEDACDATAGVVPALKPEGMATEGRITGIVWQDDNGDAIRQPDETVRLGNHTVFLVDAATGKFAADPTTGTMRPAVQTDAEGRFEVTNLPAGKYIVFVTRNPSQRFSARSLYSWPADEGGLGIGRTPEFEVTAERPVITGVDAGIIPGTLTQDDVAEPTVERAKECFEPDTVVVPEDTEKVTYEVRRETSPGGSGSSSTASPNSSGSNATGASRGASGSSGPSRTSSGNSSSNSSGSGAADDAASDPANDDDGVYPRTVYVVATPKPGYVLGEKVTWMWKFTLDRKPCARVAIPEPKVAPATECGKEPSVIVPTAEQAPHVTYDVKPFTSARTWIVTANMEPGYSAPDGARTRWVLEMPKTVPCPSTGSGNDGDGNGSGPGNGSGNGGTGGHGAGGSSGNAGTGAGSGGNSGGTSGASSGGGAGGSSGAGNGSGSSGGSSSGTSTSEMGTQTDGPSTAETGTQTDPPATSTDAGTQTDPTPATTDTGTQTDPPTSTDAGTSTDMGTNTDDSGSATGDAGTGTDEPEDGEGDGGEHEVLGTPVNITDVLSSELLASLVEYIKQAVKEAIAAELPRGVTDTAGSPAAGSEANGGTYAGTDTAGSGDTGATGGAGATHEADAGSVHGAGSGSTDGAGGSSGSKSGSGSDNEPISDGATYVKDEASSGTVPGSPTSSDSSSNPVKGGPNTDAPSKGAPGGAATDHDAVANAKAKAEQEAAEAARAHAEREAAEAEGDKAAPGGGGSGAPSDPGDSPTKGGADGGEPGTKGAGGTTGAEAAGSDSDAVAAMAAGGDDEASREKASDADPSSNPGSSPANTPAAESSEPQSTTPATAATAGAAGTSDATGTAGGEGTGEPETAAKEESPLASTGSPLDALITLTSVLLTAGASLVIIRRRRE